MYVGPLQLLTHQEKALLLHRRYEPLKAIQLKAGIHSSVHSTRD